MVWIALILSVVVLWFASLCKVFHGSSSISKTAFLNNGGDSRRRNVLLVIAHPDDESMFFAPVINYLISRNHNLHVLCMSTGNAAAWQCRWHGKYKETRALPGLCHSQGACILIFALLSIPTKQVKILDHPDLQDGFGKVWNWNLLASIIDEETCIHSIDFIITFDDYGISGHCNHCDVHQGVRWESNKETLVKLEQHVSQAVDCSLLHSELLHDASGRHLEAWELVSPNILRKYIGPVDIWLSILFSRQSYCLIINLDLRKSCAAMAWHSSQWVWFRKLFVAFSSCTYVSTLKKIEQVYRPVRGLVISILNSIGPRVIHKRTVGTSSPSILEHD